VYRGRKQVSKKALSNRSLKKIRFAFEEKSAQGASKKHEKKKLLHKKGSRHT